jgi:hypothetical protein
LVRWERDDEGRLWSEVLGAWLTMVGDDLRLVRQDGTLEPSPAEAEARAREEAAARERAEEEVRRLAEEVAHLRADLELRESNEG